MYIILFSFRFVGVDTNIKYKNEIQMETAVVEINVDNSGYF